MKDKLKLAGIDGICSALKKINKLETLITALAHKIDPENASALLGRIDDLRRSGADPDDIALRLQFHYGITEARLQQFKREAEKLSPRLQRATAEVLGS